jgi:N-acetyl-anhydromuramoyl-L-alanine amidase
MNANMTALEINADGVLNQGTFIPSPNHDIRPDEAEVKLIVIHNISLPPGQYGGNGIIELFTNQLDPTAHPYYAEIHTLKVSSHFLIRRDGSVLQFVPCGLRAWHAGVSQWQGRERCNDFSVGIELEGCDTDTFTEAQYTQLQQLIAALKKRYPIAGIAGHSDIAPGRKTDPGPGFDWSRIA